MLQVFYGTNRTLVRNAAHQAAEQIGLKATSIDDTQYQPGIILDSATATSLFGGEACYILDTPSSDEAFLKEVIDVLPTLAESPHTFIVMEGSLLADQKKRYAKFSTSLQEFTLEKTERFNPFGLAEALARKDKKQLWVLLQKARMEMIREEELVGILWWQLKTLRLAAITRTAEEAGLKEYPYKKAKQSLRNFAPGELERLSQSLLELYHADHQGGTSMEVSLEQWVLTM